MTLTFGPRARNSAQDWKDLVGNKASRWNIPKEYGAHGELFFFLIKKESTIHEVTEDEDGRSLTDGEGEHNVENFMFCSFAHFACGPLPQSFLHEEEMCTVALTCYFSSNVLYFCQD